jgi:two-component system, response regulator PdtaR
MSRGLRIAVADDERDMRDFFREFLPPLGHTVVGTAATGDELITLCRAERPDLVITDIKMPDTDGIDAARTICHERPVPVILVSAFHDPTLLGRAEAEHILAYLVKPIKDNDLGPAISVAVKRFEEFQALRKESADLRQALEDRKVIERAKGILMKRAGLDESEAFRRMQKLASEKSRKLADIAAMILVAEEAVQPISA